MGNPRPKPERLAEKLRQARLALGLSQPEMLRRLGLEEFMQYARISEYETGVREPSLMTLLQYARVTGLSMEDFVDDELDLPDKLHAATKRSPARRKKTRNNS